MRKGEKGIKFSKSLVNPFTPVLVTTLSKLNKEMKTWAIYVTFRETKDHHTV